LVVEAAAIGVAARSARAPGPADRLVAGEGTVANEESRAGPLKMPPPAPWLPPTPTPTPPMAWLSLKVLWLTVVVAPWSLSMPPPRPWVTGAPSRRPPTAMLPLNVQ
jgi:hypothetical protein